MPPKIVNPVVRRNILLMISTVLLLIAVLYKPSLLLCFTSFKGAFSVVFTFAAALFGALGIGLFAGVFLRERGNPWYARPHALIYLGAALSLISILGAQLYPQVHKGSMFLFMAFEVLWVVIVEWVYYSK